MVFFLFVNKVKPNNTSNPQLSNSLKIINYTMWVLNFNNLVHPIVLYVLEVYYKTEWVHHKCNDVIKVYTHGRKRII